ncbi:hypothetical protein BV98_003122 [Sphingobium herbicidovorans NBRC 16415]|uniref:Uncharacterized protein n=1 Tax=Sphingobium herbicidovorans (strain ATCC 700291 / DSM 11019 / CCUG 56400 / KCTC 2939 / LMG 18315 / NBRC 16415 / MH) TaxID=1219045 RepID=A0A086P7C6_SPHHM|nr:hypothetical protein [Sphingobium herbicidovorans]KFG89294.1 hypothetical protein BV98_003122 [Sphingobium herbicidovorans NBRC 16415]
MAMMPMLVGGVAMAVILLAMPAGLVETIVASSGLSEAWPAAAPPLGMKARLMLAGFGAMMAMGWVCFNAAPVPVKEDRRRRGVTGVSRMGFALPKLNWLSRSRTTGASRVARPLARRADAHPDAPARTPIFASRDFGGLEIFPRIAPALAREAEANHIEQQPAMPSFQPVIEEHAVAPEPVEAEFEEISSWTHPASADPVEQPMQAAQAPSLAELTARFERGLAERVRGARGATDGVIADMPVEQPVPVRERVEDDVDKALRAALGTLRAMADRTR